MLAAVEEMFAQPTAVLVAVLYGLLFIICNRIFLFFIAPVIFQVLGRRKHLEYILYSQSDKLLDFECRPFKKT